VEVAGPEAGADALEEFSMDKLECYQKLTKLDEQRDAVERALNQFVASSQELMKAFAIAATNPSDTKLVEALNSELTTFNAHWSDLHNAVDDWDNTMSRFKKEVLDTVQQRIKRDGKLKDIKTACDEIVVYAEWSASEVKSVRGLLELWRSYFRMAADYADEWGNTRVGY
jgi:hypothetical protein